MGFSYFFSAEFIRYPRYIEKREALMEPLGTIWNYLERPAAVERPQGYFVLFVGSRYYLRPIILWPARSEIGTAAGYWNSL